MKYEVDLPKNQYKNAVSDGLWEEFCIFADWEDINGEERWSSIKKVVTENAMKFFSFRGRHHVDNERDTEKKGHNYAREEGPRCTNSTAAWNMTKTSFGRRNQDRLKKRAGEVKVKEFLPQWISLKELGVRTLV